MADNTGGGHDNGEGGQTTSSFLTPKTNWFLSFFERLSKSPSSKPEPEPEPKSEPEEHEDDSSSEDRTISSTPGPSTSKVPASDDDLEDDWHEDQNFLNDVLKSRHEYTLMPSTWRMHFRGIPLPKGLFYKQELARAERPRIYAHQDKFEFRGAKTLRRLIALHARVNDLRKAHRAHPEQGHQHRYIQHIKRRLREALQWAELDGNLRKYYRSFCPNYLVMEMTEEDKLDMDTIIQEEMAQLAQSWRRLLEAVPESTRPPAPVLYAFVIYKHIVFIVTMDASNPDAQCHVPTQLDLSVKNQHQWNSLAIMVTACWARDCFLKLVETLEIDDQSDPAVEESDPDA